MKNPMCANRQSCSHCKRWKKQSADETYVRGFCQVAKKVFAFFRRKQRA
jgi:hypothetical protein